MPSAVPLTFPKERHLASAVPSLRQKRKNAMRHGSLRAFVAGWHRLLRRHGVFPRNFTPASFPIHRTPLTWRATGRTSLVRRFLMPQLLSPSSSANARVASFYDWAQSLYFVVDWFCRPGRSQLIRRINREPAGRLLDVGVGPGRHLSLYRSHAVHAIDCSARMIESCRHHAPGALAWVMDGEQMDFPDETFDYIALCHVLSVTASPALMLSEARRVLRPGGWAFVLNHQTPANAWRHVDALLNPFASLLCFRSCFHLEEIPGIERFSSQRLEATSGFGLMKAWSLQK